MSKGIIVLIIVALIGIVCSSSVISFFNQETKLRNLIVNKQTDNKNEMDAMWKIISQVAQVTEKDRESLMQIFNGYAESRTGNGDSKAVMNWITEAIPNVDNGTMINLQNTIVSQRDGFKFRQKELIGFKTEHDNLIGTFPNNIYAGIFNRNKIDIVIVTSTRTEESFKTGKDDNIDLFSK